jgi:uncharacterized protein (DUF1800 family)
MLLCRRAVALAALTSLSACTSHPAATTAPARPVDAAPSAALAPRPPSAIPANGWPADKQALHLLSRLAYGPRPGDLAALRAAGPDAWIEAQLHPTTLTDEALEAKLRSYPSLAESPAELVARYPRPKQAAKRAARLAARRNGGVNPPPSGVNAATSTLPVDPAIPMTPDGKPRDLVRELTAQKVLRAVMSERQLQEVLVDFWFNHFNVFAQKGADPWLVGSYERDAIRPHVFGKFRDLLGATAHHPAMLFYLDNWQSKAGALNENYGRELLELHTVGVDGGYTQNDVREVARAFTGWSIESRLDPVFRFRPRVHDGDAKTVLGTAIDAGGEKDGERVLDLLAQHPATARFVSLQLARKFVSDDPPASLVDSLAKVYLASGGDLSAVYKALFFAPELWSDAAYGAKVKTPLEVAVSALRAVGATVDDPDALGQAVARMGEPLYRCQPPTGYKSTADAWVGSGALVSRINFGVELASGRLRGVTFDREKLVAGAPPDDAGALVDRLAQVVLHQPIAKGTRDVVVAEVTRDAAHITYQEPPPDALPQALGLLLGSPEFQHR